MKKFTIFLLTFLLFVGFINVKAQTRAVEFLDGTTEFGIFCLGGASSVTVNVNFSFSGGNGTANTITDPKIFWSPDGVTFTQVTTSVGAAPGNLSFWYYGPISATTWFYAEATQTPDGGYPSPLISRDIVQIVVLPQPTVTHTRLTSDPICAGNSVDFEASVVWPGWVSGDGTLSYEWGPTGAHDHFGSPYSLGTVLPFNTGDLPAGNYTYDFYFEVKDINNVVSTSCSTLAPLNFEIEEKPAPSSDADAAYCAYNDPTTFFTVSAINGVPPYVFTVFSNGIGDGTIDPSTGDFTFNPSLAHTGTIRVVVTDLTPCSDTLDIPITINPLPVVTMPTDTAVCEGTTLVITPDVTEGTFPYVTPYTWTPTGVAGTYSGTDFTVTTTPPSATIGSLMVTVEDSEGCISEEKTINIKINENPVLTLAGTSPYTACVGDVLDITATLTYPVTGEFAPGYVYTWDLTGTITGTAGLISSTQPVFHINTDAAAAGTIRANVEDINKCVGHTPYVDVEVYPLPEVEIISPNDTLYVCKDEDLTVLTNVIFANGTVTYSWDDGTGIGIPSGVDDSEYTVNYGTAGKYILAVEITDDNCTSIPDTVYIVVWDLPVVTLADFDSVCKNASPVTLTGGTPVADGVTTFGEYFIDTETSPSTTFDPASYSVGLHDITYVYEDANGCKNSATAHIRVNPVPVVALNATVYDDCVSNLFKITANITTPTNAPYDYYWSPAPPAGTGDGAHGTTSVYTVNTSVVTTFTVEVYVIDDYGCVSDRVSAPVEVHPLPVISPVTATLACVGETGVMSVTRIVTPPTTAYQWYELLPPNPATGVWTPIALANDTALTYIGLAVGDTAYYRIIARTTYGCADTSDYRLDPVTNPVTNISIAPIPQPVCNNTTINLNATVTAKAGTHQTYQWIIYNSTNGLTWTYGGTIPLTQKTGTYRIDVDDAVVKFVKFEILVNTEGYNCPISDTTNRIGITPSIRTKIVGSGHDTVCEGGSAEIKYDIYNFDQALGEIYYRWYENNDFYQLPGAVHKLPIAATQVSITTHPSLHDSEEGPESYCYTVELWQGTPDPLTAGICNSFSECHWVTVLKDPVVTISGPKTISKGTTSVEYTANVVGGFGDPSFTWYVNGIEQVQDGNPFILTDPDVLGNIGDYDISVKVKRTYSGCEADLVLYPFKVTCATGAVSIEGLHQACVGDKITLTAIVVTDATEYTVKWKRDGQYIPGVNGLHYDFTVDDTIALSQIQVEISFCECELVVSPVHDFQAIPRTVAWVDNYEICENGVVDVQVNHKSWDGQIYRYVWYDATLAPIDTTYENHRLFSYTKDHLVVGAATTFNVQIELLNAACPSNMAAFDINVIDSLLPVTIIADTITCVNTMVLFSLNDLNGDQYGTPKVAWWVDGIEIPGKELDFINIHFHTPGTHYVYAHLTYPNNNCGYITDQLGIVVREIFDVAIAGPHTICETTTKLYAIVDPVNPGTTMNYTYHWRLNDNPVPDEENDTLVINPAASPIPYIYTVYVIDSASGCVQQSIPFEVNVMQFPNIGISVDKTAICAGETIELKAEVSDDYNIKYVWYEKNAGGTLDSIGNAPILYIIPTATTTYSFKATQIVTGCEAISNDIKVTVDNKPILNVALVKDTICRGTQKTFIASDPALPNVTYTWYIGGVEVEGATLNEFDPIFNDAGTFYVTVTATTNVTGCTSALDTAGIIEVKTNPTVTIAGPTLACNGGNLYAIVDPTGATVSYKWYENDSSTGTSITATQTINTTPHSYPYVYVVEITDTITGCIVKSLPHTVIVEEFTTIGITTNKEDVCEGEMVMLTANVPLDAKNMKYQWYGISPTNVIALLDTTPVMYIAVDSTTTYYFEATQIGSTCKAVSNSIKVNVIPKPTITFITQVTDTICKSEQVTFAVAAQPDVTYTWFINGIPQDVVTSTFSPIFDQAGVFEITVIGTSNVAGCTSALDTAGIITVKTNPTVTIAGPTLACHGGNLYAIVDPTEATVSYKWYENGSSTGTSITAIQPINTTPHSYPYVYVVEITDTITGCVVKSLPHTVIIEEFASIGITTNKEDVCEGEMVMLTANVPLDAKNMKYQWYGISPTNVIALLDTTPVMYIAVDSTTTYYFEATQIGSSCKAVSNSIKVKVIPKPTITFITQVTDTICKSEQVTFAVAAQPDVTYTWFINGIPQDVVTSTFSPIFDQAGVFEITVIGTSNVAGCTSALDTAGVITVKNNPTVTISGPAIACNGGNLYAIVDPTGATVSYKWYENGTTTNSITDIQPINATPHSYPYVYVVEITDTITQCVVKSLAHTVIVEEFTTIGITTDKENVCKGETVMLTANVPLDAKNMKYQWYATTTDDVTTKLDTTPVMYVVVNDTTTYYFEATQIGSSCKAISNYITVNVIPKPTITFITQVTDTICRSEQVTFAVTAQTGVTYTWYINGAPQDVVTSTFSPIFNQAGVYTITVIGTSNIAGCKSSVGTAGIITVKDNPIVTIVGPQYVCNATPPVSLLAVVDPTSATTNNIIYYKWYEHDKLTGNEGLDADKQVVSNLPYSSNPYIYYVEITDEESGCIVKSTPHYVWVEQYPVIPISVDKLEVCPGETIKLTANIPVNNNTIYAWKENNGVIAGQTTTTAYVIPSYDPAHPEFNEFTYSFMATESGSGCIALSNEIKVKVIPEPIVVVTVSTTDTICKGNQANFKAVVFKTLGPPAIEYDLPVIYTWYVNNLKVEGITGNELTYKFTETGVFNVTVSATPEAAKCTSSVKPAGTITVKDAPSVAIDGVHAVCADAPNPADLYAIVKPTGANVTYQWYENDAPKGTNSTQAVNTTPSAYPYIYKVEITDVESGCVITSDPHAVYVSEDASIKVTSDSYKICIGMPLSMSADITGLTNMVYQWYMTTQLGTVPVGGNSPILNFTPVATGEHTFTFVATQYGSGCEVGSNPIIVTVTAIPEKPVLTISDETICSGDQVTVTGDVDGDYIWFRNGKITDFVLQEITDDELTATNKLTIYEYKAIVTIDGCTSGISDPVSVVVHPPYTPVIVGEHYVCDQALGDEHLMLHALVNELPGVTYQYHWYYVQNGSEQQLVEFYGPDCQVPNNLPINDPSAPYYFYVKVEAVGYDCKETSAAHEVYIYPKPVVYITVDQANICQNGTVTATAHVSPGVPANYTYYWTLNGNTLPFINNDVITLENWNLGVNTIALTIQRDYANLACRGSAYTTVNVLAAPSLEVTYDIAGLNLPGMCVGGQVNLHANIVDFDDILINTENFYYEWRVNNGAPMGPYQNNNFSQVLNNPGIYNYEVRAYNNLGCATPWTAFDPVKVVPQATVTIHPKDYIYHQVCEGAELQIDNVLNITDPTIQVGKLFCWNDLPNDCQPIDSLRPRVVTFNTIGDQSFFLYVEFMNPTCNAITSNTYTFEVKTNPVWTDILVDPNAACLGETIHLSAAFKGGVEEGQNIGTIQWMYSFDGGFNVPIGTVGANKTHTPEQAGNYIYYATYAPSNPLSGCHVNDYPVPVEVSASPSARFVAFDNGGADPIIACVDDPAGVDLKIKFEGNAPFRFKIMETPGGSVKDYISFVDSFMLHVTPSVTTQYTLVYLTDNSKCSTSSFDEGYITVYVTDVKVVTPNVATCGDQVDVVFNIISSVSKTAYYKFDCESITHSGKLEKVGNQYVLTMDVPKCVVTGVNKATITIDGCEYPVEVSAGSNEPVTAVFSNKDDNDHYVCANDPSTARVPLKVTFTGTIPFHYLLVGTDGTTREMTSYKKEEIIYVSPTVTTTYYIEELTDGSNCPQEDPLVIPEITVDVTDVAIITPVVQICDPADAVVTFNVISSSAAPKAWIIIDGGTPKPVTIYQGYNTITFDITGLDYGTHEAVLKVDNCNFEFTVIRNYGGGTAGSPFLIHRRWEGNYDVLIVSNNNKDVETEFYNGGYEFTAYQWYKNGELIPGADKQYYQDPNGVNGIYSVKVTGYKVDPTTGKRLYSVEFMTCGQEFIPTFSMNVYPVPAQVGQPVWVEIDLTPVELDGAVLDIYDAKGAHIQQIKVVSSKTQVDGFKAQGTYFGKITTGTNEIKAVKFVIVN